MERGPHANRGRDLALIVSWSLIIGLARSGQPEETDPYWQIRDGLELLAGRAITTYDSWSWAPVAGEYVPNSPGWNVLLALAWQQGAFAGFFAISVASVMAYLLSAMWVATLAGARRIPALMALLVVAAVALPGLSPRAALPAQTLMFVGVALCVLWIRGMATRSVWVSVAGSGALGVAVSAAGNWVHLSWVTWALALAIIWGVLWMLPSGCMIGARIAAAVAGAVGLLVGIAMGPYGFGALGHASRVADATRGLITEWTGVLHPELWARYLIPAAIAIVVACVGLYWAGTRVARRKGVGVEISLVMALSAMSLVVAVGGLVAVRFVMVSWMTLVPVLAVFATMAMDRLHQAAVTRLGEESRWYEWSTDGFWRVILTLTAVVVGLVAVVLASPLGRPADDKAIAVLPQECRLYSAPSSAAGVLLLRPDVTVWIDGRADYWGRERLEEYYQRAATDGMAAIPSGATCVLLANSTVLATVLDRTNGDDGRWVNVFDDGRRVVWALNSTS